MPTTESSGTTGKAITPCLWFDSQAEEAAGFYVSIFKDSSIVSTTRFGDGGPGPKGGVMSVSFKLRGQEFLALNDGAHVRFTEAISFLVDCKTQEEVDWFWSKLCEGGQESQCGWLKDKYGVSWQIIPTVALSLLRDPDPGKAKRAIEALLKMKKIDIATLVRAADNND
jgi:predicted 3-demethylubiquinone-9 3-methyltransferase (glyoxalase superfamily)